MCEYRGDVTGRRAQRARAFETPLGIAPREARHRQRGLHALIIEPLRGEQPPDDVGAVRTDPPRPLLAAFPVPLPPYGLPGRVGLVCAVPVDGRGWQEPVRAEPGSPVPRLDRAGADAQVRGGPGVRVRDGIPVARVRDMAVGPHLPAVDPVRHLVRRFRQWRQQRPLLGLEHGTPGPVAFLERTGIALVQPCADGGARFVQRSGRAIAHHAGQRHGRVPYRVLRGRLVLRPAHALRYHRGGIMLGHGTVRVVEHGLAFARMADHSGLEVVAHQPRRGASEPFVHRDVAPQPRVLAHVERRLHERVPAERQHADEQARLGLVARDRADDLYGLADPADLDGPSGLVLDPARFAFTIVIS